MGMSANSMDKYEIGGLIGEGTFAKVKLAINLQTGSKVALKIIDKNMVLSYKLTEQVISEIRSMKLLHHPNIVKIYEVLATKTKIYIVMEYVSGGQLLDKLTYWKRLKELEARKIFQQLIDAVEYCHARGVHHRDLKLENLLLDGNGNLKITDFGLSAVCKPGDLLFTACGSPSYVAPEVFANIGYEGSLADTWSCGVILFELLAGYLPFEDQNLMRLYKKIARGELAFPNWFTAKQQNLILGILNPVPGRRMTIPQILENEWFQCDYEPISWLSTGEHHNLKDVYSSGFGGIEGKAAKKETDCRSSFINAFQLITFSYHLDLSGLFVEEEKRKRRIVLASEHSINETIEKIEKAGKEAFFSVELIKNFKVTRTAKNCGSYCILLAEVIEVTPGHCIVEISKSEGELGAYNQFCEKFSSLIMKRGSCHANGTQENKVEGSNPRKIQV